MLNAIYYHYIAIRTVWQSAFILYAFTVYVWVFKVKYDTKKKRSNEDSSHVAIGLNTLI